MKKIICQIKAFKTKKTIKLFKISFEFKKQMNNEILDQKKAK